MCDTEQFVDCASVQYVKQLSPSDAACSKQIKLPKSLAKRFVGELRHKQSTILTVIDQTGASWDFLCTCYGCQYALSRVGTFCNTFKLKAGQFLVFYQDSQARLRVGACSTLSPELQQQFAYRPNGTNSNNTSSNGGIHSAHQAAAPVERVPSGSSSNGREQRVFGKRPALELGADTASVKDQAPPATHSATNVWSRAPSPDDNPLTRTALTWRPSNRGAFEQCTAKRLCAGSPTDQLNHYYLQPGLQHQWKLQQQQQQSQQQQQPQQQQRGGVLELLPPPALFAPPLCRSHSSSSGCDSADSAGTCIHYGSKGASELAGNGMRPQGPLLQSSSSDGMMQACVRELLPALGCGWPAPIFAADADECTDMPVVAAAGPDRRATAVTEQQQAATAQKATAAQSMPIRPVPIRALPMLSSRAGAAAGLVARLTAAVPAATYMATPTTAAAAAAAAGAAATGAVGTWPSKPAAPLLRKVLTKMDVACAHDRVGIVLPMEEVLKRTLLTSDVHSLEFVVGDEAEADGSMHFSCRIEASADGRFAYLTGLAGLLSNACAQAGDALCISVAQGSAMGLMAGIRHAG